MNINLHFTKFKKKPVVIQACQFTKEWLDNLFADPDLKDTSVVGGDPITFYRNGYAIVKTLEGDMRADFGDWIIIGVKGELYPCKPDIFELTYEAVAE